ncbi:hypothetical protein [Pandoraea pnomenusa]|uniref:hypothetical protein n=1 Tax=Pandoraea pnomenusa TaxID=93220 RepID=UPI00333EEDF1
MARISASNGIVAFDDSAHVRITGIHRVGSQESLRSLARVLNVRSAEIPPATFTEPSAASRDAFRDDLRAARGNVAPETQGLHLDIPPPSSPGFDDPPPPYSPPGVSAPYLPASPPPPYGAIELFEAPPVYLPPGVEGASSELLSPARGRIWRAIMRVTQRN